MPTVKMIAEDGTEIAVKVPFNLPTEERAEQLRALYKAHVRHPGDGHWKGECHAVVQNSLAADVEEAMSFIGSIVDEKVVMKNGKTLLYSKGYWAHGF